MGSCVSALLASLGGKKDAKRAAWIHFLFNIVGSAIILVFLTVALEPITGIIQRLSGDSVARQVANAHTLIKVCEVIILFPFIQWIVKLTYLIVPGDDKKKGKKSSNWFILGTKQCFLPQQRWLKQPENWNVWEIWQLRILPGQ